METPTAKELQHIDLFAGLNGVRACSFTRHGGVSPAPFTSLNLSFGVGDRHEHVQENRARLKQRLGLEVMASARQVHGDRILSITEQPEEDLEAEGYDGLITNRPGLGLMVQQADCQAVLLHDPVQGVVANLHAGWRGSVAGIIPKAVGQMAEEYCSRPADLRAAISPSLGPCCAEFVNYRKELPEEFHSFGENNHFDFWAISRHQLQEAGLAPERISTAAVCSRCSQDFFSYRRCQQTGRFATIIALSGAL